MTFFLGFTINLKNPQMQSPLHILLLLIVSLMNFLKVFLLFTLFGNIFFYLKIDGTRAYRELTLKKKLVDNFFKVNLFSKSGKSFRDLSIQISEVLLKNRYLHQKQQQRFSNFCPKILKNTRFYSALVINSIISKWCSAPSSTDGTTHNTKLF
jgi:hypothetical protein